MAGNVTLKDGRGSYSVAVGEDGRARVGDGGPIAARAGSDGTVTVGGRTAWVAATADARWVFIDGHVFRFEVETKSGRKRGGSHHGSLFAPMPATVLRIHVEPGARVTRGDTLILLEAMKMELPIRATTDGIVTAVRCREGELVQPGTTLIEIDDNGS